jgi:hypothetical protein
MIVIILFNILIVCRTGSLIQYKYENFNLIENNRKENGHNLDKSGLIEMNDGTIISSSYKSKINY